MTERDPATVIREAREIVAWCEAGQPIGALWQFEGEERKGPPRWLRKWPPGGDQVRIWLSALLAALARVEQERDEARSRPKRGLEQAIRHLLEPEIAGGMSAFEDVEILLAAWQEMHRERAEIVAGRDAAEARADALELAVQTAWREIEGAGMCLAVFCPHGHESHRVHDYNFAHEMRGYLERAYAALEGAGDGSRPSLPVAPDGPETPAVDEPSPSEPEIPLGRGHARASAAEDIGSGSLSGGPPDWVRCNRCGYAWDENDPDSLVCPCLDKHGYRTVTQLPGGPLSKDTG